MSAVIVDFKKQVANRKFIIELACVSKPIEEDDAVLDGLPVRLDISEAVGDELVPLFSGLKPGDEAPKLPGEECEELKWLKGPPCYQWVTGMLFIRQDGYTYRRSLTDGEDRIVRAFIDLYP